MLWDIDKLPMLVQTVRRHDKPKQERKRMVEDETAGLQPNSIHRITPGTQLLISLGGLDERLKTVFVGLERGRHFMFRTPRRALGNGVYDYLYAGNQIIVRYLQNGHIWAFDSRIQSYMVKPHPLVFTDFPKSVQAHSLRKEHRIECFFPSTLMLKDIRWQGMIQDLSRTGCGLTFESISTPRLPKVGESLLLDCPLFGAVGHDRIHCDVRRVGHEKGAVNLGVTFSNLPGTVDDWIKNYVAQVLGILER